MVTETPIIEIPSNKIYSIDNQKVINNRIDCIEVGIKVPTIINATENVYNETVKTGFFTTDTQKDESIKTGISLGAYGYAFNMAYIDETPQYVTKTFTIPKKQATLITEILTGEDKDNQPNIKYNLRGSISKGISHGTVLIQGGDGFGNVVYKDFTLQEPTDITTEANQLYSLPSSVTDITYTSYLQYGMYNFDTTATLSLSNISNILTATTQLSEDGKSFIIELTILSGLTINKLKGGVTKKQSQVPYLHSLSGEYEKYVPTQVEVSFYGNVVKLDLQDKTLKICQGKKVYSFTGNELMQTTNTPPIKEKYERLIESWKNGREQATIRLSIDDFYDTNTKAKRISTTRENNLPMMFNIGDVCIPYVYGANGKDKPMSLWQDGTPKQFQVIGLRTIYDGAIWQELTLLEINRNKIAPPTDTLISIIQVVEQINSYTKLIGIRPLHTKDNIPLKVGDNLVLDEITAELIEYDKDMDWYVVTAPAGSVWDINVGTEQVVEVVSPTDDTDETEQPDQDIQS